MGKLKKGKTAGMDDVIGEMLKGGGDMVMNWIYRLWCMAFESDAVPYEWRSDMIAPLYKGKEERTKCWKYRGISQLREAGKTYEGILVDRVRVNECLGDNEQGDFR